MITPILFDSSESVRVSVEKLCVIMDMTLTEAQFIDTLNRHIMVFKYADSGSLRCYLADLSIELDWPMRLNLGINIVSGLAYLHEHNILHKNLVIINTQ